VAELVLFLLWQNWIEFQAKKHPPPAPLVATAPVDAAHPAGALPSVPGRDVFPVEMYPPRH